ncbi:MAG: peptide-methionine (R)-S-oxide reductase MsrB [Alphaproteobacteria bacterium]|nr:peptide-methionine (R)-S-oxide reductase MsrB [Alphaproteobacteria bacterium]
MTKKQKFQIEKTDAEWRQSLNDTQFAILRQHGTEHPGSSPLDREAAPGTYHCAGCGTALFSSAHKFDAGCGWPSFYQPLDKTIGTSTDFKLIYPRTETHCAKCGGHLGHVFDDGPEPTGQRYCINGAALSFKEE